MKTNWGFGIRDWAAFAEGYGEPRRSAHATVARRRGLATALLAVMLTGVGCRQDMHDQPKYTAYKPSDFFADRRSARPLVEGTIPQGSDEESALYRSSAASRPPCFRLRLTTR